MFHQTLIWLPKYLMSFAQTGRIRSLVLQLMGHPIWQAAILEWLHRFNKWQSQVFYCIWYAAHKLDLIVQDRFKSMFDETFVNVIQVITWYLRRQKNLIQRMKATCPCFIDSRWLSMGCLLNWLIDKRQDMLRFSIQCYSCESYTCLLICPVFQLMYKSYVSDS